jgi:hypothetical protein
MCEPMRPLSCHAARIVYGWRSTDPAFVRDWDAAMTRGVTPLEREARRRGLGSPDLADALALTFARPAAAGA